jgi:predicted AlkP superfamily phosphohydrolase/phosphomutase
MKTIILGLDAFDPKFFENLSEEGKLPTLTALANQGKYARFGVTSPPQSEVSWSSIATGLNPAGHGIFDFVHRNPENYSLFVSLLPTKKTRVGTQFVPPHNSHTIFDEAVEQGYPATSLWWPATFPSRLDSPVRNIPGLGTPDIHGRLGVGVGFSLEPDPPTEDQKIPVQTLTQQGKSDFTGELFGPLQDKADQKAAVLPFKVSFHDSDRAQLTMGKQVVELRTGQWSPILEIKFKMGFMVNLSAITRVILTQGSTSPRLYFLPLQIHPLHSPWHYATPRGFVKRTWAESGGFLSLGWPQDTTALEENLITDEQFLDLCDQIFETRKQIYLHNLDNYREGLLACVFDTLDRVQHMFWNDRPDIIEQWYRKLDQFAGQVLDKVNTLESAPRFLLVSDHGFSQFDYKVHVNGWLEEQGYLHIGDQAKPRSLEGANWPQSQAYAVGLNSIYLNLQGREGQGCVSLQGKEALLEKIRQELLAWKGPNGEHVFSSIKVGSQEYDGPYADYAPDLNLGFAAGFRASAQTGLGKWETAAIEENKDHWHADHCIDADTVPGVLFTNSELEDTSPTYRDFPGLAIGMSPKAKAAAPPPMDISGDDQAEIEERLKGLGYL